MPTQEDIQGETYIERFTPKENCLSDCHAKEKALDCYGSSSDVIPGGMCECSLHFCKKPKEDV